MKRLKLSSAQVIAGGFILMILIGAFLLSLPISSQSREATPFLDCVFTATSASCVTGLIVVDTGTHWSIFGQIILLVLIQIGALGFMSLITFILLLTKRRIGIRQRSLLVDSISSSEIGSIVPFLKRIIKWTAIFEGAGALILSVRFMFVPEIGFFRAIYFGIFHSVTAFCNAGFDLFGQISGPYSSLVMFSGDFVVSVTIALLILIGGIGFFVWDDMARAHFRPKRFALHTKISLCASLILVVGGTVLFYYFERDKGMPEYERWLTAFFDAVTPRTAGFNTVDTAELTAPSRILTDVLMLIGGGTGSTAGGIKMTTVAVLLAYAYAGMRNRDEAVLFGRGIRIDSLKRAVYITTLNLSLICTGAAIIAACEPTIDGGSIIFETISALSTVGMTTGITRSLGTVSRIVLIALMYLGRIGSVSFAMAIMEKRIGGGMTHPTENVTVG